MKQLEPKTDMPKPDGEETFAVSALALIWRLAMFGGGVFLAMAPVPVVFQLVGLLCVVGAIIGD